MDTYIPKTFKGQELSVREIEIFSLGFEMAVKKCQDIIQERCLR